ncbi:MAG: hypothetical protein OWR62_16630, partial [Sulfobacillus thermotolerans]|nr:hypothetical protein [Sulfobacillus thermotolerans]
ANPGGSLTVLRTIQRIIPNGPVHHVLRQLRQIKQKIIHRRLQIAMINCGPAPMNALEMALSHFEVLAVLIAEN